LRPGTTLICDDEAGTPIPVRQFIPAGHKIALQDVAAGAPVLRYGQIIGFASQAILAGDHVHTHNVVVKPVDHDYAQLVSTTDQFEYMPETQRRTFLGFKRDKGRAGTRNYVAVIGTVNCSAHVCREIAAYFTPERLEAYPNVDGVIPIVHTWVVLTGLAVPTTLYSSERWPEWPVIPTSQARCWSVWGAK
jgi:altronate dehydratase